jgi:hypothetical protein
MVAPLFPVSLVLTLLLSFQTVSASLGNISVTISPLEQPIIFIDDNHTYEKEKDEKYFDGLLELFQAADDDPQADPDTIEYYVFVENSPAIDFNNASGVLKNRKRVLESLCATAEARAFRRTRVIDCDPRKVDAALTLLQCEKHFVYTRTEKQKQMIKQLDRYDITTVTFQDVVNHFDQLLALMKQLRDDWQEHQIFTIFNDIIHEQQSNRALLLELFQERNFHLEDTIGSHAPETILHTNRNLVRAGIHCFCKFLDLFTLHHLLKERNNRSIKKFIIIAGNAHTWNIRDVLRKLHVGYDSILDQYSYLNRGDKLRLLKMSAPELEKIADPPATWQDNVRAAILLSIIVGIIYWVFDK